MGIRGRPSTLGASGAQAAESLSQCFQGCGTRLVEQNRTFCAQEVLVLFEVGQDLIQKHGDSAEGDWILRYVSPVERLLGH